MIFIVKRQAPYLLKKSNCAGEGVRIDPDNRSESKRPRAQNESNKQSG
jgi:hypothetical protein